MENIPSFIETYTDDLLFTDIGRRSLKVCNHLSFYVNVTVNFFFLPQFFLKVAHDYLIRASDWVLKNLEKNDSNDDEDFADTVDVFVASKSLTFIMFHIEDAAFDQVRKKNQYKSRIHGVEHLIVQ